MRSSALALCMIVRDEISNLPTCLESVRGLVDEVLVVDTGSADGTPDLAESLGAKVLHFPWGDDFAAARNAGIAQAASDWILVLDADERIHPDDRQILTAALQSDDCESVAGFILPVHSLVGDGTGLAEEVNHNVRLFRNRPNHRYQGAVHEQIEPSIRQHSPGQQISLLAVRIIHSGYLNQELRARQKPARNLAILERLLQHSPRDYHLQYHAAICLYNLGHYEEAITRFSLILREGDLRLNYSARCLKILAVTLLRLQRTDDALAALDRYQSNWPDFTDLQYLRALIYRDQGDICRALDAAIACRILGEAPTPYDTHRGVGTHLASRLIGLLAGQLGNQKLAEQAFGEISINEPALRMEVARWLSLLAERIGAERAVPELLRRLPPPRDFALAAEVCALARLYQPALDFNELATGPSPSERALFRGRCLFSLGLPAEAARALESIGPDEPEWATASLWLAHSALAAHSLAPLPELERGFGAVHPDNLRLLSLIRFLISGDSSPTESADLLVPLLRTVSPHVQRDSLARCVELAEASGGYGQWPELASILFNEYSEVELAWHAYGHRPPGTSDPWLEAAMYRRAGDNHRALLTLMPALRDRRARVADYLQAAAICQEQARLVRSIGGEGE